MRRSGNLPIISLLLFFGSILISCYNTGPTSPIVLNGGVVTTYAGSGSTGSDNGTGTAASFHEPTGVAVDASGTVYVADFENNLIRKISSGGAVTTFAGDGSTGSNNGTGTSASFHNPGGVAVDSSGNVYVADTGNNLIRKITSGGVVTTLAGSGTYGFANGNGTAASFRSPFGIAVDRMGNIYVGDYGNNMVRKITSDGVVTTLAGSVTPGSNNGLGTKASFYYPHGVAVDYFGNVYVTDSLNNLIRRITPGGRVSTLAGSFNGPVGIALDKYRNIYVGDGGGLIRKITTGGVVTTFAGGGPCCAVNGTGTAASFVSVYGLTIDASGNIYVADSYNNLIRMIQ